MSLITPTTKDINDNIIAQLQSSLNQTIPLLPKSFLSVLSKVLAGVFILLYKYVGFSSLQMFVQTASDQETEVNGAKIIPLNLWGEMVGIGTPGAAVQAEMIIDVIVEVQSGFLLSGTQLLNSGNGVTYVTIGDVLLNAPIIQATIRATADQSGGNGSGAIGNLGAGAIVSFANTQPNVFRDATVNTQTIPGTDAESTALYRQKILDRFQKRPQGGAYADYEQWGEEVSGIINVYPYTSNCPGQVDVYVEATTDIDPDGIPTTAQLQSVLDSINLDQSGIATRRPANALANTFAISRLGFDVTVSGIVIDNLPQVQIDITAAITEYFLDRGPFIDGLSVPPRRDRITASALGGLVDDIVSAAGGIFSTVIVKRLNVEISLYSLGIGEKAKLQVITFV